MTTSLKNEVDEVRARVNELYARLVGEIPFLTKEQLAFAEKRIRAIIESFPKRGLNGTVSEEQEVK